MKNWIIMHSLVLLEKIEEKQDFASPEPRFKVGKVLQCGPGGYNIDGAFIKPDLKIGQQVLYTHGEDFEGNVLVDYTNIKAHD